jgi:hypothetical protein
MIYPTLSNRKTALESPYRRRPAEHRIVPQRLRRMVDRLHHLALHQHRMQQLYVSRHRKRGVHHHAQRAALFPNGNLRAIRHGSSRDCVLRQPLAMHVDRRREACPHHQQQARIRQHTQPQRMRLLNRSAFCSLSQGFRSDGSYTSSIYSSMTQIPPRKSL